MSENPADSIHFLFEESASTSRIDTLCPSISESRTVIQLPQELITDILVRLPVKSLLRFKCVSKPWLSLISNPQFIRSHFSKSSSMDEVESSHLQLLFATKTSMKICSLYSALREADSSGHVPAIEFPAQNHDSIVGIINGLVCLNSKGNLCIWNPAFNKIKHFNFYPEPASGHRRVEYYYFSSGYDESNDDYKVVCLQTVKGNHGISYAEVYSLKADSWRKIDQLKGFYLPKPGVFANGKIYWSGDTIECKKFSLDMSSEKLVELQPPKYDPSNYFIRMGVSGGRLLMLCQCVKGKEADLWMLDKCGVEESWCKVVSIPYTDVNPKIYMFDCRVLCILSNSEIVFGNMDGLLLYNWKKKEYRKIMLDVGITKSWRVAAYVESLVWPDYA